MLIALAAISGPDRIIGSKNTLPRYLPDDLKRFKNLTLGKIVVMGRKTYESLPEKVRPLPQRKSIVITRNTDYKINHTDVTVMHSIEEFHDRYRHHKQETVYNIGGGQIFNSLLPITDYLYLSELYQLYEGDTFFPEFQAHFTEQERQHLEGYDFVIYSNNNQ